MLIELESPRASLVTKQGQFSSTIRQAITQISDWRRWLRNNMEVARKPRRLGGLGLHDMSAITAGWIVAGRRSEVTPRFNDLREDLLTEQAITVLTYDRLIEWASKRARFWQADDGNC